jgi:hypothetical protein
MASFSLRAAPCVMFSMLLAGAPRNGAILAFAAAFHSNVAGRAADVLLAVVNRRSALVVMLPDKTFAATHCRLTHSLLWLSATV